jgi:hypothetical protein
MIGLWQKCIHRLAVKEPTGNDGWKMSQPSLSPFLNRRRCGGSGVLMLNLARHNLSYGFIHEYTRSHYP